MANPDEIEDDSLELENVAIIIFRLLTVFKSDVKLRIDERDTNISSLFRRDNRIAYIAERRVKVPVGKAGI